MSEKCVEVAVKISKEAYERLEKDGAINAVFRKKNGQLERYGKVLIDKGLKDKVKDLDKIQNSVKKLVNDNKKVLDTVLNVSKKTENALKSLSVDMKKLAKSVKTSNVLGYANLAVSVADLAVSIATYVMIKKELGEVKNQIKEFSNQVQNTKMNELSEAFENNILWYNTLMDSYNFDKDNIDLYETDKYIRRVKAFISNELVKNFNNLEQGNEEILEMIYSLLPAYTSLLIVFLREYYFQKGRLPSNYENYISLYEELTDKDFIMDVKDYLFLDARYNNSIVNNTVNGQIYVALKGLSDVQDEVSILEATQTKEEYDKLDQAIIESVKEDLYNATVAPSGGEAAMKPEQIAYIQDAINKAFEGELR